MARLNLQELFISLGYYLSMLRSVVFQKGGVYHVYNRGNRKRKIYYDERDYLRFIERLSEFSEDLHIDVLGYCLMSNHYHLILIQRGVKPISKLMQRLGIAYSMYINKKYGLVGHVFQGRYQVKKVATKQGFRRLVSYIKDNPVKDGLVQKVYYYRWLEIQSCVFNEDFWDKILRKKPL